ncbi:MAG: N-acetylmuramoyl-L-alanine amidase [Anaerolineae bacterium]|nr:N-acetylmuramoyl-L-alanine amidase [Anaerolineae bacterium]
MRSAIKARIPQLLLAPGIGLALTMLLVLLPPATHSLDVAPPSRLCFWSDQGVACVERALLAVSTAAATDDTARGIALLRALLAGPTPHEKAQGLTSAFPPGTRLAGFRLEPHRTAVVQLEVPATALSPLDPAAFEAMVGQLAGTLEPLGWQDLRIQTRDPATGAFIPLATFLPEMPVPRKETVTAEVAPQEPSASGSALSNLGETSTQVDTWHASAQEGQFLIGAGSLKGKTVYLSAGHGWLWNGYQWRTQRPPYPTAPYVGPIIEDHNNAEAVNQYLVRYLQNAGATVIPVRERDMNPAAIVGDNDNPGSGYAETGTWITSIYTGYLGSTYRYTTTVTGTATATATWTFAVPADGEYAVYAWYRQGTNRAPDARYTIHHAGGATEVVVDQRIHGNTWRYLGTFGFRAGQVATVTLSNRSAYAGRAVIADAVRVGGGVFSSLTGIYTTTAPYAPNKPWWEVAAYYHVQRMGLNPSGWPSYGYFNDVVARPMYARWEHAGTGEDALYISWHSNGSSSGYQTTTRGTDLYIYNGEVPTRPVTPGSTELREALFTEISRTLRAAWDPTWPVRKRAANLGELRELWDPDPTVQMPGVLIEVAFHDHPTDTDALKEPKFNQLVARAVYRGIIRYFETRNGTDLPLLPEPPTHLAVRNLGDGRVQVSWRPPATNTPGLESDPPTGYRVYTSTNGVGWSAAALVSTTVYTLTGVPAGQILFVRVTAVNGGGESFPTEVLAVRVAQAESLRDRSNAVNHSESFPREVLGTLTPSSALPLPQTGEEEAEGVGMRALLVNGFDRLNRAMLIPETDPVMGFNLRMLLNRMNARNYVLQHGPAISLPFDSASNEAVRDGDVSLTEYGLVDWMLGEESAADQTLDPTERALLRAYLNRCGRLLISGTEIGWHLDGQGADPDFYRNTLRARYVADDAGTYGVTPTAGSIFAGLGPFRFDAPGMYDPDFPDVISPTAGSVAALTYVGGTGGVAAVQYVSDCSRLVYLAFPFETIDLPARAAVMARAVDFLQASVSTVSILSPRPNNAYNHPPPFTGTATATLGTLSRVEVQIQREDRYWSGNGWVSEPRWLMATGTLTWAYDLAPALDTDGDYHLQARAVVAGWPAAENPPSASASFIYDTRPPAPATLITPTGGVVLSALPSLTLRWALPAPDGGSPLAAIVALDGEVLTITTASVYTLTTIAEGPHTWGVQMVDGADNRSSWITDTFVVSRHRVLLPLVLRAFQGPPPSGLVNGGFETDEGWTLNRLALYDTSLARSGARSMRLGIPLGEPGQYVYSSVSQSFVVPDGPAITLSLWVYPQSAGDRDDVFYVSLYDGNGQFRLLDYWSPGGLPERTWTERRVDLTPYAGQQVVMYIGVKNDGDDQTAAMNVDDVGIP